MKLTAEVMRAHDLVYGCCKPQAQLTQTVLSVAPHRQLNKSVNADGWDHLEKFLKASLARGQITDVCYEVLLGLIRRDISSRSQRTPLRHTSCEEPWNESSCQSPGCLSPSDGATASTADTASPTPPHTAEPELLQHFTIHNGLDENRLESSPTAVALAEAADVFDDPLEEVSPGVPVHLSGDNHYVLYQAHPWHVTRHIGGRRYSSDEDAVPGAAYRREHLAPELRAGISAGVAEGCPFDTRLPTTGTDYAGGARQLPPMKLAAEIQDAETGLRTAELVRDLNMPGILEAILRRHEVLLGTPKVEREKVVKAKLLLVRMLCIDKLTAVQQRSHSSEGSEGESSDILQTDPGLSKTRRLEARSLYTRLARALDQKASPNDRLFSPTRPQSMRKKRGTRRLPWWQERKAAEMALPVFMRGEASRQLYAQGTNIFPPRLQSRLRDYDTKNRIGSD